MGAKFDDVGQRDSALMGAKEWEGVWETQKNVSWPLEVAFVYIAQSVTM